MYLAQVPPELVIHTQPLSDTGIDAEGGYCAEKFCLPPEICESDICALVLHQTVSPLKILMSQMPGLGITCENGQICIEMKGWVRAQACCETPAALPSLYQNPCGRLLRLEAIRDDILTCQTPSSYSGKSESIRFKDFDMKYLEDQIGIALRECQRCNPCGYGQRVATCINVELDGNCR